METTLDLLSYYSTSLHSHWMPVFKALLPKIAHSHLIESIVTDIISLAEPRQKDITRKIAGKLARLVAG